MHHAQVAARPRPRSPSSSPSCCSTCIALGIVIPVLPKLIESMLGGDTRRAAEIYGFFGTAWALMQFVFSPVLGALSDRFGRRPVLLVSMTSASGSTTS